MAKSIKNRDSMIPKQATFICKNCNAEFESDEFEIHSDEYYIRDEKLSLFSKYNRIYWTKSIYVFETDCPVCGFTVRVYLDRGLPENRHEILSRDVQAW